MIGAFNESFQKYIEIGVGVKAKVVRRGEGLEGVTTHASKEILIIHYFKDTAACYLVIAT